MKITKNTFIVLLGFYFASFLNIPFWREIFKIVHFTNPSEILYVASTFINLIAGFTVIFSLTLLPYLQKPLLVILSLMAIFSTYSIYYFNIEISLDMIKNVLDTDLEESAELVTKKFILWFALLGSPVILINFCKIKHGANFWPEAKSRLKLIGICVALILIASGISYKNILVIHRNNRILSRLITPVNCIYYLGKYVKKQNFSSKKEFIQIGLDAAKGTHWQNATKKSLLVIVVGEAARSKHFSLNGYAKETNPLLKTKNVISLKHVSSCGTCTAVAVPGIFSRLPRTSYSPEKAAKEENLLDILSRVGFSIRWIDNNSSSKGVACRFNEENIREKNLNDEALLEGLDSYISAMKTDGIIILHQLGSHGPAYYKRYPEQFNKFKPGCETNEIQTCKVPNLVNTYDNTILYTDYILTKIIELLEKNTHLNTAMVYVSDHGESLGEYGMYLHGTPYMIAPKEQTHIPWIIWLSKDFKKQFDIDSNSLKVRAETQKYSHDNFFHSILGLLDIKTNEYQKDSDIFKN